jgi:hypothetical protein
MKNLLYVTSLIFIVSGTSLAQSDPDQKLHFGLKASPSVTWLKVEADNVNIESEGVRIGFTYGLITEFSISKNYSFATGIDISYKGGSYSIPDLVAVTQKLQFVEVPIGFKLKTNEIGYIKYYGLFGALPGVNVRARKDIDYKIAGVEDVKDESNQREIGVFNLALNIGGGIEYNLGGSTAFTAGIHYQNGLLTK